MRITLTGMPGCGKSYTAKKLSDFFELELYDTDYLIESEYKLSIKHIFSKYGENFFRKAETNTLKKTLNENNFVLSTGGGLPCFNKNMELINEKSLSFYLYADVNLLRNRLSDDKKNNVIRPLTDKFTEQTLHDYLNKTLHIREKFYKKSKYTVKAQNATEDIIHICKNLQL
jgi:shikimate kinase